MRQYTDDEIVERYFADLALLAERERAEDRAEGGDGSSFFGDVLDVCDIHVVHQNLIVFSGWPSMCALSKRELMNFEESDVVWGHASATLWGGELAVEILLVDSYEGT